MALGERLSVCAILIILSEMAANDLSDCWSSELSYHEINITRPRKTRLHCICCGEQRRRGTDCARRSKSRYKTFTSRYRGCKYTLLVIVTMLTNLRSR